MGIRVLDEKVISQIAAGEVVSRPASVVKELVENALDAGADQITVEAQGAGLGLLRVTDNGSGIPAEEAALAFTRHATSKITRADELDAIRSLGFRGEALPSIAAVAEVEMLTRAPGETAGSFLRLEGGEITRRESQPRVPGSTVTVHNLFAKVPARRKFLKSASTENSHIAQVVTQYALAYPEVRFHLLVDGRRQLQTSGSGRLRDSVVEVYGLEVGRGLLEIANAEGAWDTGKAPSVTVSGMVGVPTLHRGGRGYLSFFVNRRWVSSRLLGFAVEEAYHGLLMTGRHPVAVLNLEIPPGEIDVNIHPAKSELKFRDEGAVFRAVQRAVRRTLVAQMPVPRIEETPASLAAPPAPQPGLWSGSGEEHRPAVLPVVSPPQEDSLPVLRVVGQLQNRYIVAEGADGLYLIDQHAAHERICFEEVRRQRAQRRVAVQGLLAPSTLTVTPRQDEVLRRHHAELTDFGFTLEPFGSRTYLVRAVPALLHDKDWTGMLRELLDGVTGEGGGDWAENLAVSIACHSAVRAGQALSGEEMRALVRGLEQADNPRTCPHGRPTVLHLSSGRMERDFGRS
ncbi:MAG: DNA mismatch repair endonuclease MutL [Chloroflexota bacterium]